MMTKKDYTKAAGIVREYQGNRGRSIALAIESAFISLFKNDNPAFDEDKFRLACMPAIKGSIKC